MCDIIAIFLYHQEMEEEKKKRNAEEMGDAMKSLENRTLDSKREMDILAALDEMKSMKVIIYCRDVLTDSVYHQLTTLFFSLCYSLNLLSIDIYTNLLILT